MSDTKHLTSQLIEQARIAEQFGWRETASVQREAAKELERLHSWDGLMSILDKLYPADVAVLNEGDDVGPRTLRLLREIERITKEARKWRCEWETYHAQIGGMKAKIEQLQGIVDAITTGATCTGRVAGRPPCQSFMWCLPNCDGRNGVTLLEAAEKAREL